MGRGTRRRGARKRAKPMEEKPAAEQPESQQVQYPEASADYKLVNREVPFIKKVLRQCDVPRVDLEDVVQDVLLGAWTSMRSVGFRPPSHIPLQDAIRRWLYGIAWRQASHYRERAHRRREIVSGQMKNVVDAAQRIDDQVDARMRLEGIRALPRGYQEVLALVGLGAEIREVAEHLGVPEGTATTRIHRGRQLLRHNLLRWRK